jgi:hypothetical protein
MKIELAKYGPIISEKEIGEIIYQEIKKATISSSEKIQIDLGQTKTMATFCAKQIFGQLYVEMGSKFFFEKLIFVNASNEMQVIIRIGIQSAIEEQQEVA